MQAGPGSNSGGGGELNREGGFVRFRSAPATWLEVLLEEEEVDPLKPTLCLTQLLVDNSASLSCTNSVPFRAFDAEFLRQNSSSVDFINSFSAVSEGYFFNYGIPGSSYDSVSPNVSPSGSMRPREAEEPQNLPWKLSSHVKQEQVGFNSSDMMCAEMDKILEASVPCRVRAKRGCATHPRSIAERIRRTRISDRIRKLQELVPNKDKQTNTADILDEVVAYVKHLQGKIEELSELQRKCTCSAKVT